MMLTIGLIQTNTGIDPVIEAELLAAQIGEAAAKGAQIIFTPEMSGLLDRDRSRAAVVDQVGSADQVEHFSLRIASASTIWPPMRR